MDRDDGPIDPGNVGRRRVLSAIAVTATARVAGCGGGGDGGNESDGPLGDGGASASPTPTPTTSAGFDAGRLPDSYERYDPAETPFLVTFDRPSGYDRPAEPQACKAVVDRREAGSCTRRFRNAWTEGAPTAEHEVVVAQGLRQHRPERVDPLLEKRLNDPARGWSRWRDLEVGDATVGVVESTTTKTRSGQARIDSKWLCYVPYTNLTGERRHRELTVESRLVVEGTQAQYDVDAVRKAVRRVGRDVVASFRPNDDATIRG